MIVHNIKKKMQRVLFKTISKSSRASLDSVYKNHQWYKFVRKHKWDELAYPVSKEIMNKWSPQITKNYWSNHHYRQVPL